MYKSHGVASDPYAGTVVDCGAGCRVVERFSSGTSLRCSEPFEAAPDPKDSEVGERGWILTCANASYRVRLIPDMAAKVELID